MSTLPQSTCANCVESSVALTPELTLPNIISVAPLDAGTHGKIPKDIMQSIGSANNFLKVLRSKRFDHKKLYKAFRFACVGLYKLIKPVSTADNDGKDGTSVALTSSN